MEFYRDDARDKPLTPALSSITVYATSSLLLQSTRVALSKPFSFISTKNSDIHPYLNAWNNHLPSSVRVLELLLRQIDSTFKGLRLSGLDSNTNTYRGEEFPAQAEFHHEPEEQATTEELNYWEEATDPDIGTVLNLWSERREAWEAEWQGGEKTWGGR